MRLAFVTIAACAVLAGGGAAAAPAGGDQVTSYPPSFFTAVRPNTALDMINALPGFTFDGGGAVRGFAGAAGNVLIDGERPATKTDGLDEILRRIPASSVARIDLIRGGAPGIDMQGKTLIANVIRKDGDGLHLTTAAQVVALYNGKFDYALRLEGAKRSGSTAWEFGAYFGTGADDGTGSGPRTITDAAGRVTRSGVEHYFGEQGTDKVNGAVETPMLGGRLRLEGSYLHQPYVSLRDDTLTGPPGDELEIYHLTQDTGELGARYDKSLGPLGSVEVFALQQFSRYASLDQFDDEGDIQVFKLGKRGGESILRGTWSFSPRPNLTLESGLEGDYNWQTIRTTVTDQGAPIPVPAANVLVKEYRGEAFVDATWRPKSTLTLEVGTRIEASKIASTGDVTSSGVFVFPKPRAVVTWAPDGADQAQLRVEREVSQLDFMNFAASGTLATGVHAGNPTLTPPQDWVVEASYDRRFWGGGDIGFALRHYWLSDAIDRAPFCATVTGAIVPPPCDPSLTFDAPANIGSGSRVEAGVSLTLPTDRLGLKQGQLIVRATWRRSRVIDPSTGRPREISGLHPVDGELHYTQNLPGLRSHWGFDAYPAWRQTYYYFSEVDTQRLGIWLDAYVEYKPREDLALKLEADNLATHGGEYIRAFYDPFRDVGGGQLSSVDNRSPRFGPELTFHVRKTFG